MKFLMHKIFISVTGAASILFIIALLLSGCMKFVCQEGQAHVYAQEIYFILKEIENEDKNNALVIIDYARKRLRGSSNYCLNMRLEDMVYGILGATLNPNGEMSYIDDRYKELDLLERRAKEIESQDGKSYQ